jgi:hypothetical protein
MSQNYYCKYCGTKAGTVSGLTAIHAQDIPMAPVKGNTLCTREVKSRTMYVNTVVQRRP